MTRDSWLVTKQLSVSKAVKILKKGGVIAYPTETFYGLGVDPNNKEAIEKIFQIKKRERGKPISLIISSERQLAKWAVGVGAREKKIMKAFWPGPLTLVFKARKSVSKLLTGGMGKIGLRISPERITRQLAQNIGGAITATSANLSGQPASKTAAAVERKLGRRVDGIVSNKVLKSKKSSTILDTSGLKLKVLREGEISRREIEIVLNQRL